MNWYGEMTAFIQWWHVDDFMDGLVVRCTRCFPWQDRTERRIVEAFEQASQTKCPVCYGTTFEGGYKAIVYAPAIWSPGPESSDAIGRHGDHYVRGAQVQPSSIVKLRDGDTAVRLDGTRWRLASPLEGELSTGFGFHGELNEQMRSAITANIQDPTTVDYMVVISFAELDMEGPSPAWGGTVRELDHPQRHDVDAGQPVAGPGQLVGHRAQQQGRGGHVARSHLRGAGVVEPDQPLPADAARRLLLVSAQFLGAHRSRTGSR